VGDSRPVQQLGKQGGEHRESQAADIAAAVRLLRTERPADGLGALKQLKGLAPAGGILRQGVESETPDLAIGQEGISDKFI
jgi:hypothetical protein